MFIIRSKFPRGKTTGNKKRMTIQNSLTNDPSLKDSESFNLKTINKCEVLGPTGRMMSISDLPPPGSNRWVPRRKAELVACVRGGLITLDEACERYRLSIDEFRSWERLLGRFGVPGLRTTRTKNYREIDF